MLQIFLNYLAGLSRRTEKALETLERLTSHATARCWLNLGPLTSSGLEILRGLKICGSGPWFLTFRSFLKCSLLFCLSFLCCLHLCSLIFLHHSVDLCFHAIETRPRTLNARPCQEWKAYLSLRTAFCEDNWKGAPLNDSILPVAKQLLIDFKLFKNNSKFKGNTMQFSIIANTVLVSYSAKLIVPWLIELRIPKHELDVFCKPWKVSLFVKPSCASESLARCIWHLVELCLERSYIFFAFQASTLSMHKLFAAPSTLHQIFASLVAYFAWACFGWRLLRFAILGNGNSKFCIQGNPQIL